MYPTIIALSIPDPHRGRPGVLGPFAGAFVGPPMAAGGGLFGAVLRLLAVVDPLRLAVMVGKAQADLRGGLQSASWQHRRRGWQPNFHRAGLPVVPNAIRNRREGGAARGRGGLVKGALPFLRRNRARLAGTFCPTPLEYGKLDPRFPDSLAPKPLN